MIDYASLANSATLRKALTPRLNKYIPHQPTIKQSVFLVLDDVPEVMYGGAAGGGKAQPLDSIIITPFGHRTMRDMKIGSHVSNPDGTVARVLQIHPQGMQDVYRVRFTDGTYTDCTLDHRWLAWESGKVYNDKRQYLKIDGTICGRIYTTAEIKTVTDNANAKGVGARRILIPVAEPTRSFYRKVASVEFLARQECQCITVDHPNGLYITNNFVVTHNSDSLLMAGLQYVDEPEYNALILRRTFRDLMQPDAILDRARRWLSPHVANKEVKWQGKKFQFIWKHSGATLTFGYLKNENDVYQYDSSAFQFIGFDELVQFSESQYRFMFGRLRRNVGSAVPLRMRAATNPGGVGHIWVRDRFIRAPSRQRIFVPAKLNDNPHLDIEGYRASLSQLDEVTRRQREEGDWEASGEGMSFKREWFKEIIHHRPTTVRASCRYWDLAATAGDGDFLVGAKVDLLTDGRWLVSDIVRGQWGPGQVEDIVYQTAKLDGMRVRVRIEREPGSAGKIVAESFKRRLVGYDVEGVPATGDKETRWKPFAAQCQLGQVLLYSDEWNSDWLDEIVHVPNAKHDDQADATSGAFSELLTNKPKNYQIVFVG